jgi:hypothetical protein
MMKYIKYLSFACMILFGLSACVTGNDDNAVLNDLEEQYAKTPRVEELAVDGVAPSRDQQSHWIDFAVTAGQTIRITGEYHAGVGANFADFDFSRTYHQTSYDPDAAQAVEPNDDRVQTISQSVVSFDFSYTVPAVDDDGDPFLPGDHINLTWWSSNDLGGQGFTDVNLIFE